MKPPWICYWDIIWISFCIFLQITSGCRLLKNEISLSWPTAWTPTRGDFCKITSIKNHKRTKVNFFYYRLKDVVRKKLFKTVSSFKKRSTCNLFVVTLSVILHHFDLYPELLLRANLNQIWNKASLGKTIVNFYNKKTGFRFNGK